MIKINYGRHYIKTLVVHRRGGLIVSRRESQQYKQILSKKTKRKERKN